MFNVDEIVKACSGRLIGPGSELQIQNVSTDTRNLSKGSIFFALRGERFDGHRFVEDAFQKGASAAVVDAQSWRDLEPLHKFDPAKCFVIVHDVYQALGELASFHRRRFNIPVVAVTGSAGKTTTKESIGSVLSRQFRVRTGTGNFNNHIGLPLNLLQLNADDQIGVFELGASAPGEIRYLSDLAEPSLGVLTCVQPVHLESFGSLESIYATKLELAESLAERGGTLIVNGDDFILLKKAESIPVRLVRFGRSEGCQYRISNVAQEKDAFRFILNKRHAFRLKGTGIFNAMNALAALAVAAEFGLDLEVLSREWTEFVAVPNRFEIEHLKGAGIRIVKDCYNANPAAFRLALESFEELPFEGRRLAVVGDMKELGAESERYHRELGEMLGNSSLQVVAAVGEFASVVCDGASAQNKKLEVVPFADAESAGSFLLSVLREHDNVFIKGSRAMKLERVADRIRENFHSHSIGKV